MTLIVLTALVSAWLGYFALWFRDRRRSRPRPGDRVAHLIPSLDAAGRGATSAGRSGAVRSVVDLRLPGDLFASPRTPQQALRRRRQVAATFVALALGSLVVVPLLGATALAVHVLADVALLLFAFGSVRRQPAAPTALADVRVLYPDRPAPSDAGAAPLRRVANG